jgi:hypothetical protein
MRSVSGRALMVAAVALSLAVAAGCGSSSSNGSSGGGGSGGSGGGATPVNSSTCAAPVGSGKYEIVSDFPMQGASSHQTKQMVQAIELTLKQHNYTVNGMTLQYRPAMTRRPRLERGTRRHAVRTPTPTRRIRP